ncbi:MAG: hypothetical protein MPJ78_06935 [Hyphomicrobiaceae bacterium]|nr:hypothetical protein [Hyphomicrobiaceae bacterium]
MLTYAVVVFAIAAAGGLVLASSVLRGQLASWPLSLLHAGLGATGLVLVLIAAMGSAGGMTTTALVILVITALGGFYLASLHLKKEVAPKKVVVIHAGAAVVGFLLLAGTVFGVV